MKTFLVVSGFVLRGGKVLLFRRNPTRRFYPGKWNGVSGHVRDRETAEQAMLRELKEEAGLTGTIIRRGLSVVTAGSLRWIVATFLIRCPAMPSINTQEHDRLAWLRPEEIPFSRCVPGLRQDLASLGLCRSPKSAEAFYARLARD